MKVTVTALGLTWEEIDGDPADHDGKELSNDKLLRALERTTTFTHEDLAKLGVQDLLPQHYIKSVNSYFRAVKDYAGDAKELRIQYEVHHVEAGCRLYLGIADGMPIARLWACRYSR